MLTDAFLGCEAMGSLTDHYWSQCPAIHTVMVGAWGSRVVPSQMGVRFALFHRLDVIASMYNLCCDLARQVGEGKKAEFNFVTAASAARALHSPS